MVKTQRKKITLVFNDFESNELNLIQNSYMMARSWISSVPSINEILEGMIVHSYLETLKDGRVLKGFANGFLKRRNLPTSLDEVPFVPLVSLGEKRIKDAPQPFSEVKFVRPSAGNYSFYFDGSMLKIINDLKKNISKISNISIEKITEPEIVRESIHYVIDRVEREFSFQHLTYLGFLYNIKPKISMAVAEMDRTNTKPDLLADFIFDTAEPQKALLNKIWKDEPVLTKFLKQFEQHPEYFQLRFRSHSEKMIGNFKSKVSDFDFYLAWLGSEMTFLFNWLKSQSIPEIALYLMQDTGKGYLDSSLDSFGYFLKNLYESSKMFYKIDKDGKKELEQQKKQS